MKHTSSCIAIASIGLGLVLGAAGAHASHYRLPVDNLISQDETALLLKAGIKTTLGLLHEVKTPAQRQRVAAVTGLSPARVDALACQVDLLRIDGIGPSMVRLMNAAGVKHARALGAESAGSLLARMTSANLADKIANVLPQEGQVAAWIAAARRLGPAIEGLP